MPDATPRRLRPAPDRRNGRLAGSGLRRRTREVVQATDPPTDGIPLWTESDGVETSTGRAVVDLATRTGIALLATGAAAADVVEDVLRLTRAYGLRSVHVDVTFSSLTVSYFRGPAADPLTVTRVVRARSQDFTRQFRVRQLVDQIVADPIDPREARDIFDGIVGAPHPYRRWVVILAVAFMGAGVAVTLGGGPLIVLVSMVSAAVVTRVLEMLAKAGVPALFAQALGAAIPAALAVAVALVQRWVFIEGLLPSLVVASGIVVLLAGLSVVGAAQDAIQGFYVTASARVFQVLLLTFGIVVGVLVVLTVATRVGVVLAIDTASASVRLPAQVLAAGVTAAGWAVSSYAGARSLLLATVAAALGWLINAELTAGGSDAAFSAAATALVIGLVVQLASRRLGLSALATTTSAIVPLLPGRATYEGIYQIVSGPAGSGLYQGLVTLLAAAGIGIGLAAGVTLGTYLAGLVPSRRSAVRRQG